MNPNGRSQRTQQTMWRKDPRVEVRDLDKEINALEHVGVNYSTWVNFCPQLTFLLVCLFANSNKKA